jgi:nucleoside diphosphate kinase
VIIDKIEKANFEIFDFRLKDLKTEEVGNLFYKHTKKDYYDEILEYMTR